MDKKFFYFSSIVATDICKLLWWLENWPTFKEIAFYNKKLPGNRQQVLFGAGKHARSCQQLVAERNSFSIRKLHYIKTNRMAPDSRSLGNMQSVAMMEKLHAFTQKEAPALCAVW